MPLLVTSIFLLFMVTMLSLARAQADLEKHAKNVLFVKQRIDALSAEALSLGITGTVLNTGDMQRMREVERETEEQLRLLSEMVKDDPALLQHVSRRKAHFNKSIRLFENLEAAIGDQPQYIIYHLAETEKLLRELQAGLTDSKQDHEKFREHIMKSTAVQVMTSDAWSIAIVVVLFAGLLINATIGFAGASFFSRSLTRRLDRLIDNSMRFAADQPLHPRLGGKDEIGHLDCVLNDMLEELRKARQREFSIVENSLDVICSIDAGGRFTAVNQAVDRIWGHEVDDLLGRHMIDIIDRDDIDNTLQSLNSARTLGKETFLENRVKGTLGWPVDTRWSLSWSNEQDSFFCVAHDVTSLLSEERQLKENEANLRTILDGLNVGILLCSDTGIIEMSNSSVESLFSTEHSKLGGLPLGALFVKTETDEIIEALDASGTLKLEGRTDGGCIFPAQVMTSSILFKGEQKLLVVISDLTARQKIDKNRQDFVSMVSHDLRAPLTTLLITVELLNNASFGELNERGKKRVGIIQAEVHRLISLVNNLLDIERLESDRMAISKEVVNFEIIVKQSLNSVGYLAQKNGIRLVTDLENCEALADASALVQVLVNLLANAIKYSPPGSAITVSTRNLPGAVEVRVTDQGRGIPASHKEAIFDRFKQVDSSDRTEKKGIGLGLAIARSIIAAHEGEIAVESEEGKGSTFWFTIPAED